MEASWLKAKAEASTYAKQIRHIIESERNARWYDPDDGVFKRVEYSDIAVLSRKKSGRITEVIAALSDEGIPVTASAAVNICDYPEIKALEDILSLIDNAEQDIPLCSALLSAMGDMTAEDLSAIRLAYPDKRFFRECCRAYSAEKKDEIAHKLNGFYAYFEKVRALAAVADAGEILSKILSETHMEARLLSRDNGAGCLKRIHRFIAETLEPEPLTVHEFLDRLRALGGRIEYSENGGENAVRVLTMHASKGLEYPVVILDDLSVLFHGAARDEVLFDEEFGLAPRCYRRENMTVCGTLLRRLCERKGRRMRQGRAESLLCGDDARKIRSPHDVYGRPPAPDARYARSFADFVDFSVWEKYISEEELFELPYQERTALVTRPDSELTDSIVKAFSWEYPFKGTERLR
ncbi:MAG: 3'-5' exonuclease [Christensenellaceae bacterium]